MYKFLIIDKIEESIKCNKSIKKLITNLYLDKAVEYVNNDIDLFLMENEHIYKFSNFKDLVYESLMKMDKYRFANFIRNIVNDHPNKNRTYNHIINDINEKFRLEYGIPEEYYEMSQNELNRKCDELLMNEQYKELYDVRKFIKDNFRLIDYNSYITENRQQAIKILKSVKKDETDRTYLRILKMLSESQRMGYMGLFIYFHFKERVSFMRIKTLFRMLEENRDILNMLPETPVNYMRHESPYITSDGRRYTKHFERLEDDLTRIIELHKAKLFVDEYPAKLKHLGLEDDDNFIELVRKMTQNTPESKKLLEMYKQFFLKKISRYNDKTEFLNALAMFVESSSKSENIVKKIKNTYNAELIFDNGELVVARVLSYEALQELANDTSWCIKDSLSYWTSYVTGNNIQLFIADLTKPSSSIYSRIGVTLNEYHYSNRSYYNTGHLKNDQYIDEKSLNKILKEHSTSLDELRKLAEPYTNQTYSFEDERDDDNNRYGGWF